MGVVRASEGPAPGDPMGSPLPSSSYISHTNPHCSHTPSFMTPMTPLSSNMRVLFHGYRGQEGPQARDG